MPHWILQPRDPLITRDGRPFGADPGARARSMQIPPPSMIAGAWRSWVGRDETGEFDASRLGALLQQAVAGPILGVRQPDGQVRLAPPAPLDAVHFQDDDQRQMRRRLQPVTTTVETDLAGYIPCAFLQPEPVGKPTGWASHWAWDLYQEWLVEPKEGVPAGGGVMAPQPETRTHVSVNADNHTAEDGHLFQTEGRRYAWQQGDDGPVSDLVLSVRVVDDSGAREGAQAVGGERRLAFWARSEAAWPVCPQAIEDAVARDGACRIILLTPAVFEAGWAPTWLLETRAGVTPRLVGAVVDRPLVLSGWDLERQEPKPTRRAAPAGCVYFLQLDGSPEARRAWVRAHWMDCVSDDEQARRDGFGLAAVGTWKGETV